MIYKQHRNRNNNNTFVFMAFIKTKCQKIKKQRVIIEE